MFFRTLAGVLAVALLGFWAPPGLARNYAILVGAADYDLGEDLALEGPPNDVSAIYEVLRERGFADEDIAVLSRDVPDRPADGRPTRANILGALEDTVDDLRKGDYLFVFFSGHGSVMPQRPVAGGDIEPDGVDEIFLPEDVGRWKESEGQLPNAIVDDEINAFIAAIADRQAEAWFVFDTCHSSDMIRGEADAARPRFVLPRALGLDSFSPAAPEISAPAGAIAGPWADLKGIVSFSAALSGQLALEKKLPDANGKDMGVFTYALVRALERYPTATYRQIAEAISFEYDSFGPQMPSPLFEGDLDRALFSSEAVVVPSWRAERREDGSIRIEAGELQGLSRGDVLSLHPFSDASAELGAAELISSDLASSIATLRANDGSPVPELPTLMSARLESKGVVPELVVARPEEAARPQIRQALALAETLPRPGFVARWVAAGTEADVQIEIDDERLLLLPSSGELGREGRLAVPEVGATGDPVAVAERLTTALWSMARYHNILKVAQALPVGGLDGVLGVGVHVLPAVQDDVPSNSRCPNVPLRERPATAATLEPLQLTTLSHCDTVYVEISNLGDRPLDVTLLYADAAYGIAALQTDGRVRIEPYEAQPRLIPIGIRTRTHRSDGTIEQLPQGLERLLVIAVERKRGDSIPLSFAHLAQPSLTAARDALRGAERGDTALEQLLYEAAYTERGEPLTRSIDLDGEEATIRIIRFNVADDQLH